MMHKNTNCYQCCHNNDTNNSIDNAIENTQDFSSNIPSPTDRDCSCGFESDTDGLFPSNPMYAQSYVPIQKMKKIFTPDVGLQMGTIFPELVSPYRPYQSIEEIEYIKNTNVPGEGCNR